uniref:Mitochondrial import inner membrane translocase subunit TIM22 n=1 Tax=Albugo laibachii Nc14 TaxID=890382 RepID=F0W9J1_9STRA|nr:Mitochondrial Protein Translocase (MPT) Family puta [Albugo laibachii Nc14]|eukprot:CCA17805.1 Mitochondrial Protein Translocase (MPT) Family puta [Albugo laibachii Nc14]
MTQNHLFGDNDCNRSLGIRYEHLQSETPPNPFLYPRSLFRLQENTGIHPVLATHPPQLVQHFQPNPILESCAGKFVMSAAMGYVMGNLFGVVLGSYEGMAPPIPIPGQREAPKVPWKESMRGALRVTAGKCRYWGNNFMIISAVFAGLECASEKVRARHDVGNELIAGCATGATLAYGQGIQAQCLGCVGFAAFSMAIHHLTDGKF